MYLDRKHANQSPEKVLFLYFKSLNALLIIHYYIGFRPEYQKTFLQQSVTFRKITSRNYSILFGPLLGLIILLCLAVLGLIIPLFLSVF
jgi:hypothetical protein